MDNCICNICLNEGWIETEVFDSHMIKNGTTVIEKCDTCGYFINDYEAALFVRRNYNILSFPLNGINVKINFYIN